MTENNKKLKLVNQPVDMFTENFDRFYLYLEPGSLSS